MEPARRDRMGIAVGAVLGAIQPLALLAFPLFEQYNPKTMLQVCVFGLVAPPLLALINKAGGSKPQYQGAISRQINSVFMIIAWGIASGLSGFAWHALGVIPQAGLIVTGFFGSAGVGFFLAHRIYPELAASPEEDA